MGGLPSARVARHSRVWIAEVRCSEEVEHKLWVKHGLAISEVRRAVLFSEPFSMRWDKDPLYGERLIVRTVHPDANSYILVILAPLDEMQGIWVCKTARRDRR